MGEPQPHANTPIRLDLEDWLWEFVRVTREDELEEPAYGW
jgi:hypothetical protein